MADIVERLDNINICVCDYMTRDSSSDCETVDDAKDTITRLRAENAKLRATLECIYQCSNQPMVIEVARVALGGE